jgi:YcaO-like protein with predicted kinase domain
MVIFFDLVLSFRAISPSETVERMQSILKTMGVTRVANVTGLDVVGIPTVLVMRPNARSLSVTQGKGTSLDAAKASGIMECFEHFLAERISLPLTLASYVELSREKCCIDARRLPGYVRPFTANDPLFWLEATGIRSGSRRYVPFEMVHLNFTWPLLAASGFFPMGSNGLASGNTLAEALTHALWELIERDALALFYQLPPERQWLRRVRAETVDDVAACSMLERYESAGVRVGIWEITSDIPIAAYYCCVIDDKPDSFRLIGKATGYGCHLDSGVALCRALCEAAQSRLTRITGSRDDIRRAEFDAIRSSAAVIEQRREFDMQGPPVRCFRDAPLHRPATFEDDLTVTMSCLASVGIDDAFYVDLSRPEFPGAVVRALVPGLEGMPNVPGYVPGERARRVNHSVAP